MPINPMALSQTLPGNDYKFSGGLGGFVSGMQLADYLDNMDRGRMDDDLQRASSANKLQNELLDNPLLAAQREQKLNEANTTNDMYNSGDMQEMARQKVRTEIDNMKTKQGENAVARLGQQSDFILETSKRIESGDLNPLDVGGWRSWSEQGSKLGLTLPETLDPESMTKLRKMGQVASITKQEMARTRELDKTQTFTAQQNKLNRESNERIAQTRASNTGRSSNPMNRIIQEVMNKDEVSGSDISQFSSALVTNFRNSPGGQQLQQVRKDASDDYRTAGTKRTQEMIDAGSPAEYANRKAMKFIQDNIVPTVLSFLDGKTLTNDSGEPIGTIGQGAKPLVTQKVMEAILKNKELFGNEGTTQGSTQTTGTKTQGQGKETSGAVSEQSFQGESLIQQAIAKNPALKDPALLWQELRTSTKPAAKELYNKYRTLDPQYKKTDSMLPTNPEEVWGKPQ